MILKKYLSYEDLPKRLRRYYRTETKTAIFYKKGTAYFAIIVPGMIQCWKKIGSRYWIIWSQWKGTTKKFWDVFAQQAKENECS